MMDVCHPSCCAFRISAGFAVCVASGPTRRHRTVGDCHLRRCHRRQSQPLSALILSVLLLLLVRIVQLISAQTVEPMAMRCWVLNRGERSDAKGLIGRASRCMQIAARLNAIETFPPDHASRHAARTSQADNFHTLDLSLGKRRRGMERGFMDSWRGILKPSVQLSLRRGMRSVGVPELYD